MEGITSIVIAGVGGQGSILAGRVIARAAALEGLRVVTSEVHGMSQRGGSVESTVRFGRVECAPVVPEAGADYLVSFEMLEAVRSLHLLRPGGVAIVSAHAIPPSIESLRTAPYPDRVEDLLQRRARTTIILPALAVAQRLGDVRIENSVLLGALARFLGFSRGSWHRALRELVPRQTLDLNQAALNEGERLAEEPVNGNRRVAAG